MSYKNPCSVLTNPIPGTEPFFTIGEQEQFVAGLICYELIKISEKHDLPLKKGGTTDIYINLRDGRNHHEAISFVANSFANPLRRLGVQRFGEVPQAVSCFAGLIAERLQIPMYTVREEEKKGRATTGLIIGNVKIGERNALIDDVITDGASKVVPYQAIVAKGVHPNLVVLVDRQQGWKKKFADLGINMPVWAGMTLHAVRYHLDKTFGILRPCDPEKEEKNPIILALDGKSWEELLPVLSRVRNSGCILKINNLLHNQSHRNIVDHLSVYGRRIMLDFKGHDIPETVKNTCLEYRHLEPWAVTVHGSGGKAMIEAAVKAFEGTKTKVLVVTVLTSIDPDTCEEVYHTQPLDEVKALAKIGNDAGCHGFVCSGEEVDILSGLYSDKEFIVPGVRSPGVGAGDQKRVVTPEEAKAKGATKIVGGRQFLGAPDPVEEINRVITDELGIQL